MQQNPTVPIGSGSTPGMPTQPIDDFQPAPAPVQPTQMLRRPTPTMAWLAIASGSRAGRLFNLDPHGTLIGRDAQSDIVLDDDAVSRQHAKIKTEEGTRKKGDQFYIYDLGTSNGTYVNDRKVVHTALHDGDTIRIGETQLVFKMVEPKPTAKRPIKKRKRPAKSE